MHCTKDTWMTINMCRLTWWQPTFNAYMVLECMCNMAWLIRIVTCSKCTIERKEEGCDVISVRIASLWGDAFVKPLIALCILGHISTCCSISDLLSWGDDCCWDMFMRLPIYCFVPICGILFVVARNEDSDFIDSTNR